MEFENRRMELPKPPNGVTKPQNGVGETPEWSWRNPRLQFQNPRMELRDLQARVMVPIALSLMFFFADLLVFTISKSFCLPFPTENVILSTFSA